jgi:hypothetical protein
VSAKVPFRNPCAARMPRNLTTLEHATFPSAVAISLPSYTEGWRLRWRLGWKKGIAENESQSQSQCYAYNSNDKNCHGNDTTRIKIIEIGLTKPNNPNVTVT